MNDRRETCKEVCCIADDVAGRKPSKTNRGFVFHELKIRCAREEGKEERDRFLCEQMGALKDKGTAYCSGGSLTERVKKKRGDRKKSLQNITN